MRIIILFLFLFISIKISSQVVIKINNDTVCEKDTIVIPVMMDNIYDIGSIGLKIGYDMSVLKYVNLKNINTQLTYSQYNNTNGILSFAWIMQGLQGSVINGKLFDIVFIYYGQSTILDIIHAEIFRTFPLQPLAVTKVNGSVTEGITYILEGKLLYNNSVETPLKFVELLLCKNNINVDSTITDGVGKFIFDSVHCGTYMIKVKINIPYRLPTPIDALMINRYYLGTYNITDKLKLIAADVNADNKVNPMDALLVNKRYQGSISSFKAGDWYFESTEIKMNTNIVNMKIKSICIGDVRGIYIPN